MSRRTQRRIEAYLDGAVSAEEAARVERILEGDEESDAYLRRAETLGQAIRDSWTEGPPAPAPELLIHAIRPGLRQIDREIEDGSSFRRLLKRVALWLSPSPLATPVAVLAVTALLAVAIGLPQLRPASAPVMVTASLDPTVAEWVWSGSSEAVYELAQEDAALMVFTAEDGSTIFWILDDDTLSLSPSAPDSWA